MCDYSLEHVASRPARVGDKLVSTGTSGFAAIGQLSVAVCLLPGTELAFRERLQCESAFGFRYQRLKTPRAVKIPIATSHPSGGQLVFLPTASAGSRSDLSAP